jgi:hypothetical protein
MSGVRVGEAVVVSGNHSYAILSRERLAALPEFLSQDIDPERITRWASVHRDLYAGSHRDEPLSPLVAVHVRDVADGIPCSLDGFAWGRLHTAEQTGKDHDGTPARYFELPNLDGADNLFWPGDGVRIGARIRPEYVFVARVMSAGEVCDGEGWMRLGATLERGTLELRMATRLTGTTYAELRAQVDDLLADLAEGSS